VWKRWRPGLIAICRLNGYPLISYILFCTQLPYLIIEPQVYLLVVSSPSKPDRSIVWEQSLSALGSKGDNDKVDCRGEQDKERQ